MSAALVLRQFRHGVRMRASLAANLRHVRRLRESPRGGGPLVAVLLLEHLGDLVACGPVARRVKERHPGCHLVWGVRRQYRELVEANPDVDTTLGLHCLSERLLLARSGVFDRVYDLHFPERYCSLCREPARREGGSPVGLGDYFRHGGILAAFARTAGLPALDDAPRLAIPRAAAARVDRLGLPERYVAVCCSSNFPAKDWPAARWAELAGRVTGEIGVPVVEVGTVPVLPPAYRSAEMCGRLSILESAEVIRRAALFVGVDSGPAHLCCAVGTRGVVLMGSFLGFERYNPFSGPWVRGEGVEIVGGGGAVADLPVDLVFAAAREALHAP